MPLETATYLSDLVTSNPAHTDGLSQADSHARLIKSTIKATFPNFTAVALASTQAQLDAVAALLVSGQLTGNGACPPGMIADFGSSAAPTGWLICDGALISRTGVNAALFAAVGVLWGAGDGSTTFALPQLKSRYRRHRDAAGVAGIVGTVQASQNQTHTHTVAGTTTSESVPHSHAISLNTGAMSVNASHSHAYNDSSGASGGVTGGGGLSLPIGNIASNTNAVNLDHTHLVSGNTGNESAVHTHDFSATSSAGSVDGTEARPLSASVLTCIKL